MPLAQLFFRRPAGAVDHSPALDGRSLADFFRPARQVFIFVRLQELARIVVGGAVQHAVAVPRPDRHIGDRIRLSARCWSSTSSRRFTSIVKRSMAYLI